MFPLRDELTEIRDKFFERFDISLRRSNRRASFGLGIQFGLAKIVLRDQLEREEEKDAWSVFVNNSRS